jgi:hypothetical protein
MLISLRCIILASVVLFLCLLYSSSLAVLPKDGIATCRLFHITDRFCRPVVFCDPNWSYSRLCPRLSTQLTDWLITYLLTYLLTYSLTHSLTHSLTPWSRVLLEKLTGFAASQEIPRIYGTRKFITVPTSARHLSLSWARLSTRLRSLTCCSAPYQNAVRFVHASNGSVSFNNLEAINGSSVHVRFSVNSWSMNSIDW